MSIGAAIALAAIACAAPLSAEGPDLSALGPRPLYSAAEAALRRAAVLADRARYATVGASGCEFATIREALAAIGDGRIICLMDPVHREAGIAIGRDVSIVGFGAGASVLEAAASAEEATDRVLSVATGAHVRLSGLTIRHGRIAEIPRRAGGISNSGELELEDCAVLENIATYGVGVWTEGRLAMRRCVIAGNRGKKRPPADEYAAGDCGGRGSGLRVEVGGSALLIDCLIAYNEAPQAGGALHVSCGGSARLVNCTLYGNTAGQRGGGIDLAGGKLELERCTIAGNTSAGKGQAFFNRGEVSMRGCLLASKAGSAYFLSADGGGEPGRGYFVVNEGNFCESGGLPGAAEGRAELGPLADNGGPVWTALPPPASPATGYGARPAGP